jgi:IMP dehydrogenase
MIQDPITIGPEATLEQANALMGEYKISGLPVTIPSEKGRRLVGILTNRDLSFEPDFSVTVESRMTKMPLKTLSEGVTLDEAKAGLKEYRLEKLPVVDAFGCLKGLITSRDIKKQREFPLANKDRFGRLVVGAAVGVGGEALPEWSLALAYPSSGQFRNPRGRPASGGPRSSPMAGSSSQET